MNRANWPHELPTEFSIDLKKLEQLTRLLATRVSGGLTSEPIWIDIANALSPRDAIFSSDRAMLFIETIAIFNYRGLDRFRLRSQLLRSTREKVWNRPEEMGEPE